MGEISWKWWQPIRSSTCCWQPCRRPRARAGRRSLSRWTCRSARCSTSRERRLSHVYFPDHGSIVSLLYVMEDGASAEIAVVGQRRHRRHFAVHGRRIHAEPAVVQSAGQGFRLKAEAMKEEFNRAAGAASAAALHAGADHPDGADRGLQPPPFARSAIVPLAAAEPGSPAGQRARDDAGIDRQHAGRAPRRRHRGGRQLQKAGLIRYARGPSRCWIAPGWKGAPASAMRWSRNTTGCFRIPWRPEPRPSIPQCRACRRASRRGELIVDYPR